ncbi:MAG TPA: hypothetical protein VFN37_00005, partial [Candidatus Baltobacteraceae bacterium]|nr:hypothetical protein [Candidatus Baltobacteraceae bacterium]
MRIARIAAAAFFCAATLAGGALTRAGSTIPDIVQRAAAFNSASMTGVIVAERHVTFTASAGPAHFSQQNDAIVMLEDGEYKRVRYLRIIENGRPYPPDRLAQKEAESNGDLEHGKSFFKQPFDARYLHDYTFAEIPCACSRSERRVGFTSLVRDDQHGDGTMIIDGSTGRVLT